jgi:hypothetical protein
MSAKDIIKASLLAHLPEGAMRQLVEDGDEDKLYDAIAEVLEEGYTVVNNLGYLRDPDNVADLEALEREYGFISDPNLTEEERRKRIKALKYAKAGSGTAETMQNALHLAGFTNLVVVEGRQTLDPDNVVYSGAEYVVNGFEYFLISGYDIGCNETVTTPVNDYDYGCNETVPGGALPNIYNFGCLPLGAVRQSVLWDPTTHWHLVFYVAEEITVDGTGLITSITPATIDRYYRKFIREIILRLKPLHTWGSLNVAWSDPAGYGFGYFPFGITPHGL